MRLDHLADVSWSYDLLHSVAAGDGSDGQVFGQGTAQFSGRIAGPATWSNFPRIRQGYAFPDAHGSVTVDEGGVVLFTVTGMSSLDDGSGVHVMTFRTEHNAHLWLNRVIAVGEGRVDTESAQLAMRYYECTVDVLPTVGVRASSDR